MDTFRVEVFCAEEYVNAALHKEGENVSAFRCANEKEVGDICTRICEKACTLACVCRQTV